MKVKSLVSRRRLKSSLGVRAVVFRVPPYCEAQTAPNLPSLLQRLAHPFPTTPQLTEGWPGEGRGGEEGNGKGGGGGVCKGWE